MKVYGILDEDPSAYDLLSREIEGRTDVLYIVQHARKPEGKRCTNPGLLRVQCVLTSGKVITARQESVGAVPKIERN